MTNPIQIKLREQESRAVFHVGCIMGILYRNKGPLTRRDTKELSEILQKLDIKALERFLKSDRSNPEKGSDFRYRETCLTVLREYRKFRRELS